MSTKPTGIVARVLALLQITDEGRISHFYAKQRNILEKDIKNANKNISTLKDRYDEDLETLNEQIEDAKERVEEAYTNVKPENVSTNDNASNYRVSFWQGVEKAEKTLKALEEKATALSEAYEKSVKEYEEQITERKRRLVKIA